MILSPSISRASLLGLMVGLSMIPGAAFAAQSATQVITTELLPTFQTGPQSECQALSASPVTTNATNGIVSSFDFAISNPSYVSIAGTAGAASFGFTQMTRRTIGSTTVIHVDINNLSLHDNIPVSITLLSQQNNVTCLSVIRSTLIGDKIVLENIQTSSPTHTINVTPVTQYNPVQIPHRPIIATHQGLHRSGTDQVRNLLLPLKR